MQCHGATTAFAAWFYDPMLSLWAVRQETHPSFRASHEKTMIIDRKAAFIHSLNREVRYLAGSRDYAIMTTEPKEV